VKKPAFVAPLVAGALCTSALTWAAPTIQFEQTVYDFGKVSLVESVSGTFKFRNAGDQILKLNPPEPSCGCTVASLEKDTLKPGESGELAFTMNLGNFRATMEKHINVKSNDPLTPVAVLTVKADYTPLYDLNPTALALDIPLAVKSTNRTATLSRTDGKKLHLERVTASQPWIHPRLGAGSGAEDSTTPIQVEVLRDDPPRRYSESVQLYADGRTNGPVATLFVFGRIMGELNPTPEALFWRELNPTPEALFWSITDAAKIQQQGSSELNTRRVTIRSATGKDFELKNPQSSIEGMKVDLVAMEPKRVYELVAVLNAVPKQSIIGNLSVETSITGEAKIDIPVTVSVIQVSSPVPSQH
jgi:hypothetical protein